MTVAVRSWIHQNPVCVASSLRSEYVSRADANWCDTHVKDDGDDDEGRAFSWLGVMFGVADSRSVASFFGAPGRMMIAL